MAKKQIDIDALRETALEIDKKLDGFQYAIRGTASLLLQGYDMIVEDIDIVCDERTASACNTIFYSKVKDAVAYSESNKFKSYFGSFTINGILVEVMGCWQIKNTDGEWSKVYDGSEFEALELSNRKIHCTPVSQELETFIHMGRWNAYHKLKKQHETRIINDSNQLKLL